MRKSFYALVGLLIISLALCGAASAKDDPVPAFSVPENISAGVDGIYSGRSEQPVILSRESQGKAILPRFTVPERLAAGEPLVLTFDESFDDEIWIYVDLYQDDSCVRRGSFSSFALENDYTLIEVENGLDSGEYTLRAHAELDGYENSDEVIYTFTVAGERPAVPMLEVVKNNASSDQPNEIRITGENIDSFVLWADYFSDVGFWVNAPVAEDEMSWSQVSDSEILVQVDKPYGAMSVKYTAATGVGGIYSGRSEQSVTLTWQKSDNLSLVLTENLQLNNVTAKLESDRTMLSISGLAIAPENVAEILIASWQDSEPTASDAQKLAQYMTDIWKGSEGPFPERLLPFFFGVGRPVSVSELGKTQYIILAGLDTDVNLVGYAVVKVKLPDPVLTPITIELPDGVDVPSLAECEEYNGWDQYRSEEGSTVFYMNPRTNLPYRMSVQFINGQTPGVGFEVDVTGTEADPRADKDNPVTYNALQIHYWAGKTEPSMVWMTTAYSSVGSLFDSAYIGLYYGSDFESLAFGYAMLGINSNTVRIDYNYGWQITDEVRTAFSAGGLLEERLAWLNAYQPKPLTVRKTDRLSIYDLIARPKALYLPASLQEIESQAFIGVEAEEIIIPASVQTIADDAFDDEILVILPDTRLEDWAKEHHPNYRIGQ